MKRQILMGVLFAGLMLGASAWLASQGAPDHSRSRLFGVILGLLVAWMANGIPKTLTPLAKAVCDPAKEQRLRRLVGIVLTLGGLGYALASLLAPATLATPLAVASLGGAVVITLTLLLPKLLRRAS